MNRDSEHLRLLAIFHYVVAGLTALLSLLPIVHLVAGILAVLGAEQGSDLEQAAVGRMVGWFLIVMASSLILLGLSFAACLACTGRFLFEQRHYYFCLVTAAFNCFFAPLGTVLGVLTLLVLVRPSVMELFGLSPGERPTPAPPHSPREAADPADRDETHLRLLALFHYLLAGMASLLLFLPTLQIGMSLSPADLVRSSQLGTEGSLLLWAFAVLSRLFFALVLAYVFGVVLAGRFLARHRRHTFCLVMAVVNCLFVPFGTVLGVFTILVLVRPTVMDRFAATAAGAEG